MKPFLTILLLVFAGLVGAIELTDTQGRTIQAEILKYHGDRIDIRMGNGRRYTVNLKTLTDESRKAAEEWHKQQLEKMRPPFQVLCKRRKFGKSENVMPGSRYTTHMVEYDLTLKNTMMREFDGVEVEYILFVDTGIPPPKDNDGGRFGRGRGGPPKRGTRKFKKVIKRIDRLEQVSFDTDNVLLAENTPRAQPGSRYVSGHRWEDEMEGIWIRIYVNGVLVQEHAEPESLMKKKSWENQR